MNKLINFLKRKYLNSRIVVWHYLLSLLYYKKRTFLSVLGVSLGIAILIIVLSLGKSLKNYISKQMEAFGPNILFVAPKAPELDRMSALIAQAQGVKITTLKEKDLKDISRLPWVEAVNGSVMSTDIVSYKSNKKQTSIVGIWPSYPQIDKSFKIAKGRMFKNSENNGLAKVVIIGQNISKDLFGKEKPIGKYLKIGKKNFKVIGIIERRGNIAFLDIDSLVFVPCKTLQKIVLGINYFSEIDISIKNTKDIPLVKKSVSQILRANHRIKDPKKDDFEITTSDETIRQTSQIVSIINALLFLLASISLIVGGVSIMNMMIISVKERTKEIGLRKACGAKNSDILRQFLLETSAITLLGGLLGILLGIGFASLVFFVLKQIGLNWQFKISFFSLFLGIFLAFLEGIIFGIFPAWQASKKDPVKSLAAT